MNSDQKNSNASPDHCGDELRRQSEELGKNLEILLHLPVSPAPVVDTARIKALEAENAHLKEDYHVAGVKNTALQMNYDNLEQQAVLLAFDRDAILTELGNSCDAQLDTFSKANRELQGNFVRASNDVNYLQDACMRIHYDGLRNTEDRVRELDNETQASIAYLKMALSKKNETLKKANAKLRDLRKEKKEAKTGRKSSIAVVFRTMQDEAVRYASESRILGETIDALERNVEARNSDICELYHANQVFRAGLAAKGRTIEEQKRDIARLNEAYVRWIEDMDDAKKNAAGLLNLYFDAVENQARVEGVLEKCGEELDACSLELAASQAVADRVPGLEAEKSSLEKRLGDEQGKNLFLDSHLALSEDARAKFEAKSKKVIHDLKITRKWQDWAGMGARCALDDNYVGALVNYRQAMDYADGEVKPYLDFANLCLFRFRTTGTQDAINCLTDALEDCHLSRNGRHQVLDMRAELYKANSNYPAAVADWKSALGKPVLGWIADRLCGLAGKRKAFKRKIMHAAV